MAKNLNLKELIMLEGEEVIYYVEGKLIRILQIR